MKVLVCGGRDYSADEKEAATVKPDLTVGVEVVPVKAVAVMGVRPAPAQESSSIGPAPADLRALAETATPGPWQVVTYRTPFAITRYDGTTCSGEHVGRDIATVRHHPQSHAPVPIVTLGIGVTQETPVPFVFIRPEDADYLAAVSPEVVLALLDTIDSLRASLAAAQQERDEALRDAIEFTQKVDAGLVRDEEYLRLHREKMEQYDRRVAAEARAEKAEAERDALQAWQPIETAPENTWLRTKRAGEAGENVSKKTVHVHPEHCPEPETEWVDREGRTTVTHHSFLEPTHWMPLAAGTPCDPADPCAFAQDLASENRTLDGLLAEAKERAKDAEARGERMRAALMEVRGSFDAALVEGLQDRLAEADNQDVGSLHDLVVRRIMFADQAARTALAEQEAGE